MDAIFISKVKQSLCDGTFRIKTANKIRQFTRKNRHLFWIDSAYAKEMQYQAQAYQKLQRKYADVIREGVDTTLPRNKCSRVWICWFQGLENAPSLVRACVASVQQNMPDHEIVILTEQNIGDYVQFPDYIYEKRKKGIIGAAHFSDLLRIGLLIQYGGIWVDSTVLCTASAVDWKPIMQSPLFVYRNINLAPGTELPSVCSNWFLAGDSHSPILMLTQKLLFQYWKEWDYALHYYIFHMFFTMATKRYPQEWSTMPAFNNHSPHMMGQELGEAYSDERWQQYLGISSFHKLNRYMDYQGVENCNYCAIIQKYAPEFQRKKG